MAEEKGRRKSSKENEREDGNSIKKTKQFKILLLLFCMKVVCKDLKETKKLIWFGLRPRDCTEPFFFFQKQYIIY